MKQALFYNKKVLLWDNLGRYKHINSININSSSNKGIWSASKDNLIKTLDNALNFDLIESKKYVSKIYQNYINTTNYNIDIFKYLEQYKNYN